MRSRIGVTRGAAAAGCALALALAGCSNGGDGGGGADGNADSAQAAPETVTSTVTTTAGEGTDGDASGRSPSPTPGGNDGGNGNGDAGNRGGGQGRGGAECGVDESAPIITDSIAGVEPPSAGDRWELTETNYDSCGELTYALFHQMPQGNSQFATKILMFHDGEYLGVDASTAPQQGWIIGEGDGWFEVEYKDWEALMESGEPNAASPKYTTTITFTWSDEKNRVVLDGELPNQNLY